MTAWIVSDTKLTTNKNNMDELIEEYPDIDQFLKVIKEDTTTFYKYKNSCLNIKINLIDSFIKIHTSQLDKISNCEKADAIQSFKYLDSHGIKFKNYYEICLSISHNSFTFFEDTNDWRTSPLRFIIDKSQFEISPISSLMVLLTEPIYSDNNSAHYDFHNFASIKFALGKGLDYKTEFCKALYYLNSFYLKPIGFYATLMHLELNYDYSLEILTENGVSDIFKKVSRKNNSKRKDFDRIEPLNLYNESVRKSGEQRFLLLYRILEFFIKRSIVNRISDIRYDRNISADEILTTLNFRNEEQHIKNLLEDILTEKNKKKISKYCSQNVLIDADDFISVSTALYKYRNSLVHAKETEINKTMFPNPFEQVDEVNKWIYVVDEIALMCIKKYNEKLPLEIKT